jgi:hypothetical protein
MLGAFDAKPERGQLGNMLRARELGREYAIGAGREWVARLIRLHASTLCRERNENKPLGVAGWDIPEPWALLALGVGTLLLVGGALAEFRR